MSIRLFARSSLILSILFVPCIAHAAQSVSPGTRERGHISTIVFPKYIPTRKHYANKPTGVWISGRGRCLKLILGWGDGKPPTVLHNATLPVHFTPHTYIKPGLFRITARGVGCSGKSNATILILPVKSKMRALLCPRPKISQIKGIGGTTITRLVPGKKFIIGGCGFGTQGIVRIAGPGLPGGGIQMTYRQWSDKRIVVTFPTMIGIKDQRITIFVHAKKTSSSQHKASNHFRFFLQAIRASHTIRSIEVVQTCGHRTNRCGWARSSTMSAEHGAPTTITPGTYVAGIDTLKLKYKLINGWRLKRVVWAPHPSKGSTVTPIYKLGTRKVLIRVRYRIRRGGRVSYYLTAIIEGPKGVSYSPFRLR